MTEIRSTRNRDGSETYCYDGHEFTIVPRILTNPAGVIFTVKEFSGTAFPTQFRSTRNAKRAIGTYIDALTKIYGLKSMEVPK